MVETVREACDGSHKWLWYDVWDDLVKQGGLAREDISIDPLSVREHGCGGKYLDYAFYTTWVKDRFFLLSMSEMLDGGLLLHSTNETLDERLSPLVRAFARVLEYDPFGYYYHEDRVTAEWDKDDPLARLAALRQDGFQVQLFQRQWPRSER